MARALDRYFLVGETIDVAARVSKPGTRTPADATVEFVKVQRVDGAPQADLPAFTRLGEGHYQAVLATAGWTPGTYDVVMRVSDGPSKVVLKTDRFALRPAP